MNQQRYRALGLMSGTSLDGLDIVAVDFNFANEKWTFEIESATCINYPDHWKRTLSQAHSLNHNELKALDAEYGSWLGKQVNGFIEDHNINDIDLIGSHGHTVHHLPPVRQTVQIGNGPEIYTLTGIPVVCDFRLQDVLLGGQGAPLVPIGDQLLFDDYDACLNLGGFANISFDQDGERKAFDICPVNIVLNQLCEQIGLSFDKDGEIARKGTIIPVLLEKLNDLPFYAQPAPKSLGREWVEQFIYPEFTNQIAIPDLIATYTEHTAQQIAKSIIEIGANHILISGGGAFNSYLVKRIQSYTTQQIVFPSSEIIKYKEALVFAFLGVLRWVGSVNCLSLVTGSKINHSSGRLYRTYTR